MIFSDNDFICIGVPHIFYYSHQIEKNRNVDNVSFPTVRLPSWPPTSHRIWGVKSEGS